MNKTDTRTVCNSIARNCWNGLQLAGVGAAEITRDTGIEFADFSLAGGRINAEKHRRLTEYLQRFPSSRGLLELQQDDWFGDHASLAGVCFNSPTLRLALQHYLDLRGLIGEFDLMAMRAQGGEVEFSYIAEFALGQGAMQAFANFKMLAFIVRAYDSDAATVFQLELEGRAPTFAGAMGEFFGAAVRFGQPRNLLRFNAAALDRCFHGYNNILAPHLLDGAQRELRQIRRAHLFSSVVEQAIGDLLFEVAGADSASLLLRLCERMAMTPWSLRRRLQQERSSFSALEMKVKGEAARKLLRERSLSVGQISDYLGFSSQSAFTRFFKAHYQVAPVRYRMEPGLGRAGMP